MEERPSKRRRLSVSSTATTASHPSEDERSPVRGIRVGDLRPISPPPRSRPSLNISSAPLVLSTEAMNGVQNPSISSAQAAGRTLNNLAQAQKSQSAYKTSTTQLPRRTSPSPIQLTKVDALGAAANFDTVSLRDILGDPLIKECWAFNYLFDVDWLIAHFDEDVRAQVQVKLIHGFWKREDQQKIYIDDATKRYPNTEAIAAYMPEMFGTHHSKMFIIFKHDDTAQVVILTANMLARDWRMTQAVWRSPWMPLLSTTAKDSLLGDFGSGSRFKHDLMSYLRKYELRLRSLTEQLMQYDFSAVKGALIASAPGKQNVAVEPETTLFGWPGLAKILRGVPTSSSRPHIVSQVSSVGTLGVNDKWLRDTLFGTLSKSKGSPSLNCKHSIVFPTAEDIRRSHEGYDCGGSIHWKIQKPQNQKQLQYMRQMLCHWAGDYAANPKSAEDEPIRDGGRKRAGPHIKTYIRFADSSMTSIDWAMVTSANLSKQAWGEDKKYDNSVRVCSYEIGVVVWPQLYAEGAEKVKMVPTFKTDIPEDAGEGTSVVGFRMPYDLPLVPYSKDEDPWCCTASHDIPDWKGDVWPKMI